MTSPGPAKTTTADTPTTGEATDPLDEDLTRAVERSYAMRLTTGANLSDDERKRIQAKQRSHRPDDEVSTGD